MPETTQTLSQKAGELETAVAEVQRELARADATRQSEAHRRLSSLTGEARNWLEARRTDLEGEAAAADARRAEEFLHEIRMLRAEL